MDRPAMINAMKASISEVLEQMFFLPIDMVEAQQEETKTDLHGLQTIAARVGFNGAPSGAFLLAIPSELATSITADFLGSEPETLTTEQVTGTVKEMINMLAGNSLSAYDPRSPFNLEIPELASGPNSEDTKNEEAHAIDIKIETLDSFINLRMTEVSP